MKNDRIRWIGYNSAGAETIGSSSAALQGDETAEHYHNALNMALAYSIKVNYT